MTYAIRDLNQESETEIDTVSRWCIETVLDTIPEFERSHERARAALPNFTFEQMRDMIRADFERTTHRFLVAVDDEDRLVGHSMVSRKVDDGGRRFGYFFTRYVDPDHRRQGVGSALLSTALAWFDEQRWDYLLAQTHAMNDAARTLFERRGFMVVERQTEPWPALTLRLDSART